MTRHVDVGDVRLAVHEWYPAARGREDTILLAHATGFHGRCWDEVVRRGFPGRHVVAVDQRGHGRSGGTPPVRWRAFGEDLLAIVRALDLRDVVGVGHSMGGHATVEAAALEPARFRRLVLIDPVIGAPDRYAHDLRLPGEHPTAKRRARFASIGEMRDRFAARPPFDTWDPIVLLDYCTHGLSPAPDGHGWTLACAPTFEAEVYMTSFGNAAIHERVAAVECPVLVVRAPAPAERELFDFRSSPTWPPLASAFRHGGDRLVAHHTHFLPMEDPLLAARFVVDPD